MAFLTGVQEDSYGADAGYQSFDLLLLMAEFWSGRVPPPEARRNAEIMAMTTRTQSAAGRRRVADRTILHRLWPRLRHRGRAGQRDRGPDRRTVHPRSHTRSEAELPSERCRRSSARRATEAESSGPNGMNQYLWCRTVGASIAGLLEKKKQPPDVNRQQRAANTRRAGTQA